MNSCLQFTINNCVTGGFKLEDTLLYKKYKEEIDHVLKHKWYMSEKAGRDVGHEKALLDWLVNHKERKNKLK
jgi:hypothetical protein